MPIIKLLVPILFLSVFGGATVKHPLHVSTTEADYNSSTKSIEITCKIFSDDFERALSKNSASIIDLTKVSMKPAMNKEVAAYLLKNLRFKVDGKLRTLEYIGFETDREATNIYFEIKNVPVFKSAEIYNTILFDLFTDQMSIVHVVKNEKRISNKAIYPEKVISIKF